ncbi:MAG: hypothetical protein LUC30_00590 [Clostridiales bacterium]|nr:hypothetical protein [Clostridiales bacterium]
MTSEQMESSLERLERKLGLEEPEEDVVLLLEDELLDAEGELMLYLGVSSLEEQFLYKTVELAALYYQRDRWELESGGLRTSAYSEGQISQSEQYLSPAELRAGTAEILDSLARFRRVSC